MKVRNCDVFAGLNAVLFGLMGFFVYFQRFTRYRGPGNVSEFFVYACAIVFVIIIAWACLRQSRYPTRLYVVTEIGILAHFAGAFVSLGGVRLYDMPILGLGYDKYVHFLNAAVGAALLSHLFEGINFRPWLRSLVILMIVLGAGSVVEILEFMVSLTIPNSGVGGYNNNMGDLVANLAGAVSYVVVTFLIDSGSIVRPAAPHPQRV